LEDVIILNDHGRLASFHHWTNSNANEELKKELKYRFWFEDYNRTIHETKIIIEKIGYKIKNYVGYKCEARVPMCEDICGIFIMNINQFFEGCMMKWVKKMVNRDREDIIEGMFHEITISIFKKIFEKETGENNKEAFIKLILDTDLRESLRKSMAEEEKKVYLMTEREINNQMNSTP
jgi:hypothetical protein